MTFILKDRIICVGKFSVENQDTEVNRRLHCASKNSKLFIIKPDGEYKNCRFKRRRMWNDWICC